MRRVLRSVVTLTIPAVLVVLASWVPGARAEVPEAVEDNMDGVVQGYQREILAADGPCNEACEAFSDGLRYPPAGSPVLNAVGAGQVSGELIESALDTPVTQAGQRTPLAPMLALPASLPLFGAAIVGGAVVYAYVVAGDRPNRGVMRVPVGPQEITSWEYADPTNPDMFLTYHDAPNPYPTGYVASGSLGTVMWQTGPTGEYGCNVPKPVAPEGLAAVVEEVSWYWNDCEVGTSLLRVDAHTWNLPLSFVMGLFASDVQPPPGTDTLTIWPNPTISAAEIEQRVRAVLSAPGSKYDSLRDWMDSVMGGESKNPRYLYATAPTCAGGTASGCTTFFRNRGFTGTITTKTLSQDDAVMEQPAGHVTGTTPAGGSDAILDSDITIWVNPETMPQMTPTETLIAETLKTKNPDTVTDTNKKTIARACVRFVTATGSGRQAGDCTLLPIFVTGNDAPTPAENDVEALTTRNAAWVTLNRRVDSKNSQWYRGRTEPEPGCPGVTPFGMHCHEFPYWSTMQAYDGKLQTLIPSIRYTPAGENRLQGGRLKQFYSNNAAGKIKFRGCDLTAEALTSTAPAPTSAFLNVPIGGRAEIPTLGICNKSPV